MSETVYKLKTNIDDRVYIGCSKDVRKRLLKHQSCLRNNRHSSKAFQQLYNEHKDEIIIVVEEIATYENASDARELEKKFLNETPNLLNSSNKNTGGDYISNHVNRKQLLKRKQEIYITNTNFQNNAAIASGAQNNNYRHGKCVADRKCPNCGGNISPYVEVCISCRDTSGEKNPFYGKSHSEDTKQRLREARLGKPNLRDRKPVSVDGVQYPSLGHAAQALGVSPSTILYRVRSPNYPNVFYI